MKKLNLKLKVDDMLQREQLKTLIGGYDPDAGGGSTYCQCVYDTGTASGPESSCDSCISYCQSTYGSRLISTWCFG